MDNRGRPLSEKKRARIRRLLREGMSVRNVARNLHVAASTVQKLSVDKAHAVKI
ncbi:helix-turn-helix domain-containing protein [Blastopirellula marina]|uniref:helix-turn-helix domain-containing protein n=1 Tax=Blastopirellula marina TaxID=124 RepID=UPI0002E89646